MTRSDASTAPSPKRCLDCGYTIHYLYDNPPRRCPKCGREFDADSPTTIVSGEIEEPGQSDPPYARPLSQSDASTAPPPRTCTGCGYIIDHLSENRCPECGREFDPEDPTTFRGGGIPLPRGGASNSGDLLTWAVVGTLMLWSPLFYGLAELLGIAPGQDDRVFAHFGPGTPVAYCFLLPLAFVGFVTVCVTAGKCSTSRAHGDMSRSIVLARRLCLVSLAPLALLVCMKIAGELLIVVRNLPQ